ncbi:MAG TPA: ATP synthase F1 subunit delta [Candidatus Limnocylindrales bacterium]
MPLSTGAARRYAEAAFDLAHADGDLDGWAEDLRRVAAVGADDRAADVLDNPTIPATEREEAVAKALAGKVRDDVLRLAQLAVRRGRASVLPAVSSEFDRLLDRERGIVTAVVTSAGPLSDADAKAVSERVAELRGASNVRLEQRVDESLIGGLTVRIGDRLIDASVRGRLERLRARIVAGGANALEERTTT